MNLFRAIWAFLHDRSISPFQDLSRLCEKYPGVRDIVVKTQNEVYQALAQTIVDQTAAHQKMLDTKIAESRMT